MRRLRYLLFLPIFLFITNPSHSSLYAAERGVGFTPIVLTVPGVMLQADCGDLDGNGEQDLVLVYKPSRESYEKWCAVHFQQDGAIKNSADLQISLGDSVSAMQVADIDSDGTDELYLFDNDGALRLLFAPSFSGEPERVLQCKTILPGISRHLTKVSWMNDVNSDERVDVLVPVSDGMKLFLNSENSQFIESGVLEFPLKGSVKGEGGQNYVSYRLPHITFSDFDGDGHTDVGAFDLERMDFFLTNGGPVPTQRVWSPLVRKFTKDFVSATGFQDLNNDGVPDAVIVLMSQKKNLQSEVQIYFGRQDLSYADQPTHVYSGDARLILPLFLDVTGDGKMEMLLQDIDVGFGFFLNYFLANRIRVSTGLHKILPDGTYDPKPWVQRPIYIRVSEAGTEPARGVGDFNGDGLDDLAVGRADDRLSIYLADKETGLSGEPAHEYSVPAYGAMSTLDLNSDDRSDIIILYSEEERAGQITVLLSK